jgi:hypothetical protein
MNPSTSSSPPPQYAAQQSKTKVASLNLNKAFKPAATTKNTSTNKNTHTHKNGFH